MARFDNRVAVITGAASGIGKATAERFAADGARVACLDLSADAAAATAATIHDRGGEAHAYAVDVSDAGAVTAAIGRVVADIGPPEIVCNIAGIGRFAHSTDQTLDGWNKILAVNLTGTFLVSQACLPHLLENGGNIVNTASTAGLSGQPYSAAYCASKGGVVMLTKALAYEYIERGVRVNAVAPGGIETPIMGDFAPPEDASRKLMFKMLTPMGFAKPAEVASVFAWIASDEARYMTGSIVTFDGGMTA